MTKALLLITGAYQTGGGIAVVNRLALHALVEAGYDVEVHVLNETELDKAYWSFANSQLEYHTYNGKKHKFTWAAWRSIWLKKYDLILVDHINLASILSPCKLFRRVHYIVWLFGIEVFSPRPDWQGWIGLKAADKRFAISEYTRQRVQGRFPGLTVQVVQPALDPERHQVVNLESLSRDRPELFLHAMDDSNQILGDQVILLVGRMESNERYKGHDRLILAFPLIAEHYPASQLVLVGDGGDSHRLQGLAHSLPAHLQGRIFMPGFVSDEVLDHLYKICYLFAMPSTGEGFGLVYLEAMARAKPCLGGRVDAAPYLIRDGISGMLVDAPCSPSQIAEKTAELLGDPERANQMGLAGYNAVKDRYLFPHFKERFFDAIQA
jgi:phosphatidyl-myo-inositol dimannoside synthase